MVRLLKKLPISQSPHQNDISIKKNCYFRLFKDLYSAAALILIEQMAIQNRKSNLNQMLIYFEANPFHNYEPKKLYHYRAIIVSFKSLISKLFYGIGVEMAVELFYDSIQNHIDSYQYFLPVFTLEIFKKAGYQIISQSYRSDYKQYITGEGLILQLIEEEDFIYGYIQGDPDFIEIPQKIKLNECSICTLPKQDLYRNIFCNHQYCQFCIRINDRVCPKRGCNGRIISRLMGLGKSRRRSIEESKPQIQVRQQRQQIKQTKPVIKQPRPEWPPRFTGPGTPDYIQSQHILIREIMEEQNQNNNIISIDQVIKTQTFCGRCLIQIIDAQMPSQNCKHPTCLRCQYETTPCLFC
ncbi:hypothetical protein pb186bvf_017123 [Paramecium bursaria]